MASPINPTEPAATESATTESATTESATTAGPRAHLTRPLTVLVAAALALAGWGIIGPLLGVDLAVRAAPGGGVQQVGPAAVATVAVLTGLAGWALLMVMERLTKRARAAWTAIALVLLLVSLAGPLAATTPAATVGLAALHLVVAAVLIVGLRRSRR